MVTIEFANGKLAPHWTGDLYISKYIASSYRAAAFDVTGRKTTETSSVIFRFSHKTAWQESSNFYSDLRNASRSELTKYYCVNYHCSAVTMPIRSSSYATSSTSELLVSVQLPLNSMFFAMRKYSVTWFCYVNAAAL